MSVGDAGTRSERPRRRGARRIVACTLVLTTVGVGELALYRAGRADFRPTLGPGETLGVDVSHYQGPIDWSEVADDGITFAYIKSTEAGDWVDDTFATNWRGAQDAGLLVGAYHFFTLCRTGADQAANVLRVVPLAESDLPIAVDLEFPNNCSARPDPAALRAELREFLGIIEEATGEPVLLYVETAFDDVYAVKEHFDGALWERSLFGAPAGDRWVVWQASDRAEVDGVEGGVDLNLMRALWPSADVSSGTSPAG